jgi:hypothetical protein
VNTRSNAAVNLASLSRIKKLRHRVPRSMTHSTHRRRGEHGARIKKSAAMIVFA